MQAQTDSHPTVDLHSCRPKQTVFPRCYASDLNLPYSTDVMGVVKGAILAKDCIMNTGFTLARHDSWIPFFFFGVYSLIVQCDMRLR